MTTFAMVPVEALQDDNLTPAEFKMLVCLLSFKNQKTGQMNPSQDSIKERIGIRAKETVSRTVKSLEQKGWIKKTRASFGGRNNYELLINSNCDESSQLIDTVNNDGFGKVCEKRQVIVDPEHQVIIDQNDQVIHDREGQLNIKENIKENRQKNRQGVESAPQKKTKSEKTRFNASNIDLPSGINSCSWAEWVQTRAALKKPITELASKKQIKFLLQYDAVTQENIINASIMNGWQGLFPPKDNVKPFRSVRQPKPDDQDLLERWARGEDVDPFSSQPQKIIEGEVVHAG